jgi:hypothetical protein
LILGDIAGISLVEDDPGIDLREQFQPLLFPETLMSLAEWLKN